MTTEFRPLRSVLYMPANNERALAKAASLPADALILDLEDAVAPGAKSAARQAAVAAVASGAPLQPRAVVRVNGLETPWGAEDLAALAGSAVRTVLLPKVNGPQDVLAARKRLQAGGQSAGPALWIMAETAAGLMRLNEILAADPGIEAVVMGTNDLAMELRLDPDPERLGLQAALSRCVLAARAQGVDIIDGVYGRLADEPGFLRECEQGRRLGFDGKSLIHPRQIEPANRIFGVSEEAVARAEAIVAAWEAAAAADQGVAVLDGQMIEELHARAARRVLALHAAVTATAED